MFCEKIEISRHAIKNALERGIDLKDALEIVRHGEIIKKYLDTKPHPCYLLLGYRGDKPIHVVVAKEEVTEECWLITVYYPDPDVWNEDFKSKK